MKSDTDVDCPHCSAWWRPLVESGCWCVVLAVLGTVLMWHLHTVSPEKYASRWDAECSGWTRGVALVDIIVQTMHFVAYMGIAFSVLRFHPMPKAVPTARLTFVLTFVFIAGCGLMHGLSAIADVYPAYNFLVSLGFVNGVVSLVSLVMIDISFRRLLQEYDKYRASLQKSAAKSDQLLQQLESQQLDTE